ncbi:hypothetical protein B296_00054368, partial [Ensete ventricosum]
MVGSRFRSSAIDFNGQQLIEGEINRQRWIKGEKGKKKKKKEEKKKEEEEGKKKEVPRAVLARTPSQPAGRLRAVASLARGRFFSRARGRSVSPSGEKDRGN